MLRGVCSIFIAVAVSLAQPLFADQLTIDFESLNDGDSITNQFPGVGFSDALAVVAGITLNDADVPPHSGIVAALDYGGPMTLTFLSPVLTFDGFFTYSSQLTIAPFDESNNALPVVTSSFTNNFVSSGNPPNEELSAGFAGGISKIVITGNPAGTSFVVDDVTITFAPKTETAVPEPSSFVLLGLGVGLAAWRAKRRTCAA